MDMIQGLIRDVVWEVFNRLDGGSCHAISVVSKSWYAFVAESIPEYISYSECFDRARTGHYLHVMKHLKLPGKFDEYITKIDNDTSIQYDNIMKNAIQSGNMMLVKKLFNEFPRWSFEVSLVTCIVYAYKVQHYDILKYIFSLNIKCKYTNSQMLLMAVCLKGDFNTFRTMMLLEQNINNSLISFYIGVGGDREIYDNYKTNPYFDIDEFIKGICVSGNISLLEYVSYSDANLIDKSYLLGKSGNIQMLKIPNLDFDRIFKGACTNNQMPMATCVITKVSIVGIEEGLYTAFIFEYVVLLSFILDFIKHNPNVNVDVKSYELKHPHHDVSIAIIKKYIS